MHFCFIIILRVHCWNNYGKNKGKECPDLELRYYIECSDREGFDINKHIRKRRSPIVCQTGFGVEELKGKNIGWPLDIV